jgi:predicted Zn-dependent protease
MGKDRLAAQSLERALARGVRFNVNDLAWIYAASADAEVRNPARAVELAKTAVGTKPNEGVFWNTLGVAYHAAGAPNDALAALEKSMALRDGGDAFDWFFVAMSKHKLEQGDARQWFDKAVAWMDEHKPDDPELRRFRAEAAKVLGLEAK